MNQICHSRPVPGLPFSALFAAVFALSLLVLQPVCPAFGPAAGQAWAQGLSGPGASGAVSADESAVAGAVPTDRPTPDQDFSAGYAAFTGQGAVQDYTLAASRLLRAARAGHQGAQALAGYMNLKGLGMPVNAHWAVYWLNLALSHPGITPEERALSEGFLSEAKAKSGAKQ